MTKNNISGTKKPDYVITLGFIVLALLALSFTVFSTLKTKSIFFAGAAGPKCSDSDGGYDPFVKGTINGPKLTNKQKPADYCVNDNMVVEYGCSNFNGWLYGTVIPNLYSNSITCQSYDPNVPACSNGACTYWTVQPGHPCNKDDGGDIYTKGHLTSDVSGVCMDDVGMCLNDIYDFCTTKYPGQNLVEFTCNRPDPYAKSFGSHNAVFENAINCPKGCLNGACIK